MGKKDMPFMSFLGECVPPKWKDPENIALLNSGSSRVEQPDAIYSLMCSRKKGKASSP